MPLYEYLCVDCGRRTEVLQRLDEPPLATCPYCQGALTKQVSAPAFHFKGSGWYVTDYARKGGGGGATGDKEGAAPAAATEAPSAPADSGGEKPAPAAPPAKPDTKTSTDG